MNEFLQVLKNFIKFNTLTVRPLPKVGFESELSLDEQIRRRTVQGVFNTLNMEKMWIVKTQEDGLTKTYRARTEKWELVRNLATDEVRVRFCDVEFTRNEQAQFLVLMDAHEASWKDRLFKMKAKLLAKKEAAMAKMSPQNAT